MTLILNSTTQSSAHTIANVVDDDPNNDNDKTYLYHQNDDSSMNIIVEDGFGLGNVVRREVDMMGPGPPIAVIIPGRVYWHQMGKEHQCEVLDCKMPAYKMCDYETKHCGFIKLFKGCGRKMCMNHCELTMAKNLHGDNWLVGHHCKTQSCVQNFKRGNLKEHLPIFSTYVVFSVILLIFLLYMN